MMTNTGPAAGYWQGSNAGFPVERSSWVIVNAMVSGLTPPEYPNSTKMTDSAAEALLTKFAPVVYLSEEEQYFPASVPWYLPRVTMVYGSSTILPQVTKDNINCQQFDGDHSYLLPNGFGGYVASTNFQLSITDPSTYTGMGAPVTGQPQAPVYGVVIDNHAANATDLLYFFFYAYNGLSGLAFYNIGVHEGDLEHVIVRLSADQSSIVGMYCQAHASDDPFSKWYYPPGSGKSPEFTCYDTANQHPVVYSAAESHASYTSPGSKAMGWKGIKGSDTCDQGYLWNAVPNVVRVSLNKTSWLQYSGRWGATDGGFLFKGKSPDGPVAQGWLKTKAWIGAAVAAAASRPRADGPAGA